MTKRKLHAVADQVDADAPRKLVKATKLKPGMQVVQPDGTARTVRDVRKSPSSKQTTTAVGGKTWRSGYDIPAFTVQVHWEGDWPYTPMFKTRDVEVLDA